MSRFRFPTLFTMVATALPMALLTAACSKPPEQAQLTQFFRAAKARDNATLAMMSAVEFSPREVGTVESFSITSVSPEARRPLGLKALLEAEKQARAAETDFARRKMEYQTANLPVIEQVVKLERDPAATFSAAQQAVKTACDTWRSESTTFTRAVSAARTAVTTAIGPTEASLTQPGQPAFDPTAFDGELLTKDVAIAASVKDPQGQTSDKTLTVTLARAVGMQGGATREGRWIITKIAGV